MGPIDIDDLEHEHRLFTEQRLFRRMLWRLSAVCFMTGVALYCIGTVLEQQGVVVAAALHTILPLGCCVGIIMPNDDVWQSGKRLWLQTHKLCVALLWAMLSFDLGVLCAAIGV